MNAFLTGLIAILYLCLAALGVIAGAFIVVMIIKAIWKVITFWRWSYPPRPAVSLFPLAIPRRLQAPDSPFPRAKRGGGKLKSIPSQPV